MTKGIELFHYKSVFCNGVRSNGVQPFNLEKQSRTTVGWQDGLPCLKKDTQSIYCCHTTREEGGLIVLNVIRAFRPTKRCEWTGQREKKNSRIMFRPRKCTFFAEHLKKVKNNLSEEWLATGNITVPPF